MSFTRCVAIPFEFRPQMMKNFIFRHTIRYLSCIISFQIINIYSMSGQNRASELL